MEYVTLFIAAVNYVPPDYVVHSLLRNRRGIGIFRRKLYLCMEHTGSIVLANMDNVVHRSYLHAHKIPFISIVANSDIAVFPFAVIAAIRAPEFYADDCAVIDKCICRIECSRKFSCRHQSVPGPAKAIRMDYPNCGFYYRTIYAQTATRYLYSLGV